MANITDEERLYRPKVIIEEKIVEVEKIVEKVKEVKKFIEVEDKRQVGIQKGLNDLNNSVRAHQQKLENDLKEKQASLEEGEQQRLQAEEKLKELQQRVLGLKDSEGGSGQSADVILKKQQASYRKAQDKLAQQQKKEQKLEELRKQIEAEQDAVTKQLVAAQNEAKKQKNDLTKVRSEFETKIKDAKKEAQRLEQSHKEHLKVIKGQVTQQEANIKFLTQIAEFFLNPTELSKIWERSKFDENERRWQLPTFRSRSDFADVRLPDKSGMPAKMAIDVDGHLLGSDPSTGSMGPRLRQSPPCLPEGWKKSFTADSLSGGNSSAKLEKAKQKAKEKVKKLKKATNDMCEGISEIKTLLEESVTKISGSAEEKDVSAAMALLRNCVSICDKNSEIANEITNNNNKSSSKSSSKSKR